MPQTTLSLQAPISTTALPPHPVLQFYPKYTAGFANLENTDPTRFYSESSTIAFTDGTTLQGATKIWAFYRQTYGPFTRSTGASADLLSLHIISDEATGTHTLHMEMIRYLQGHKHEDVVKVPQYFVYTIGKADPGAGTDGLQIKEVRCYYDYGLIKSAAAAQGIDVTKWKTVDIDG
jgi:hypothetical protein